MSNTTCKMKNTWHYTSKTHFHTNVGVCACYISNKPRLKRIESRISLYMFRGNRIYNQRMFRSPTSDKMRMERWKAEKSQREERSIAERRKRERERVRRKKIQARELRGRSGNTAFSNGLWVGKVNRCGTKHMLKSKCTNTPFSEQFWRTNVEKCTQRWREAQSQVKIYKTHQSQKTCMRLWSTFPRLGTPKNGHAFPMQGTISAPGGMQYETKTDFRPSLRNCTHNRPAYNYFISSVLWYVAKYDSLHSRCRESVGWAEKWYPNMGDSAKAMLVSTMGPAVCTPCSPFAKGVVRPPWGFWRDRCRETRRETLVDS